jgi:hypothetical protein
VTESLVEQMLGAPLAAFHYVFSSKEECCAEEARAAIDAFAESFATLAQPAETSHRAA